MLNYLNEKLYKLQDAMRISGLNLHPKMRDYLHNRVHMFPDGIKWSNGKGVSIYYPTDIIGYCERIRKEKKKGLTYPEIKEKLKTELEVLYAKCDFLKRQFELEKKLRSQASVYIQQSLFTSNGKMVRPDLIIKVGEDITIVEEIKINTIKNELKVDFKNWDGKSTETLYGIKQKIDELEALQVRKRIKKEVAQMK